MNKPKTDAETLLLVDDTPDNLVVMKKVLQRALPQVEIVTFQKPAEVMDYVRSANVSAAIFDVQMPVLNGIELCQEMKSEEETRHIPVILVTSHEASSGFKTKGLDAGADDFLTRPIDSDELVARVKVALRINRAEAQLRRTADQVQQDYQLLFETEPGCVKIVSPEGVLLNMNPSGLKMIEAESLAQAQSQPLIEFVAPEYQAAFRELLGQVIQGQSKTLEFECVGLKGRRCWLESRAVPLWDAEHSRTNLLSVTRDITDRKQTTEALIDSDNRMADIIFSMADWVWETDAQGVYTYSSPHGSDLLGLTSEEIIGKTPFDFMPPDEAKRVGAIFSELVAHKAPIKDLENWNVLKNGERVCLLTNGVPILDEAGDLKGYRGVDKDITEAKLAEEQLRASELKRRRLFETMSEGVFYQLADGQLVDVNSAALQMFGLSRDEFLGRTSMHSEWDVIREDGTPLPGHEHPSMQALSTGKPVHALVVGILNPQTKAYTWVSASAIPEFREGEDTPYQAVVTMHDITARKSVEEALRQAQAVLEAAMDQSTAGIAIADAPSGNLRYVNDAGLRIRGGTRETVVNGIGIDNYVASWHILDLDGRPLERDEVPLTRAVRFGETCSREFIIRRSEDDDRMVSANAAPIRDESGNVVAGIVVFLDITERRQREKEHEKLQAQLNQAQKMESVGRLAGGVAHDFNNMLMGVMNYAELCRDNIEPDHPIREWLNEITVDAERSTKLTHQLLAFARKQIIAPKLIDVNDAIGSMLKLVRRLIGEDITVNWRPGLDVWSVKMDPVQLDQILANLAVNARDAIGGVGSISIETSNVTFDAAYCADHAGSVPGDYALLTVTDSGCGMDEETLQNIFEPFFTTKGVGEGTGLGLATVYGIVKQNNGYITVDSEPGHGTTFKIYLPRHVAAEAPASAAEALSKPPRGTETVLLVEDEKSVRVTVQMFLEDLGYTVLVEEYPEKALSLAAQHAGEIHLLITDVIMPGMSGRDLANRLLELRPVIKRLFISGFTADVIAQRGILPDGVNFLSKPFGRDALALKVREVLDE